MRFQFMLHCAEQMLGLFEAKRVQETVHQFACMFTYNKLL